MFGNRREFAALPTASRLLRQRLCDVRVNNAICLNILQIRWSCLQSTPHCQVAVRQQDTRRCTEERTAHSGKRSKCCVCVRIRSRQRRRRQVQMSIKRCTDGAQLGGPACLGSRRKYPVSSILSAGSMPELLCGQTNKLQHRGFESLPANLTDLLGPAVVI